MSTLSTHRSAPIFIIYPIFMWRIFFLVLNMITRLVKLKKKNLCRHITEEQLVFDFCVRFFIALRRPNEKLKMFECSKKQVKRLIDIFVSYMYF